MDPKDIKKLLEAVAEADVNEFTLETGDYKLSLKRGEVVSHVVSASSPQLVAAPAVQVEAAPVQAGIAPAQASVAVSQDVAPAVNSHFVEVIAPIVGTFYAASSPDTPDYVKVGDKVSAGTVLCIIEAMKLMNEIEAETTGVIAEILVNNEDPVEYGQTLFRIDPS